MQVKILFIGHGFNGFDEFKSRLSSHYECLFMDTNSLLSDVLKNWHPHLIFVCDHQGCEDQVRLILKQSNHTQPPGIFIMAKQYSLRDENNFYKLGCDQYLLWNTPISSVLNRINAFARRHMTSIVAQENSPSSDVPLPFGSKPNRAQQIQYENISIVVEKKIVEYAGKRLHLTPTQFKILTLFCLHIDEILDRKMITSYVWGTNTIHPRTIDAHIAKLKKSIPFLSGRIQNIYGQGYRLQPAATHKAA